MKKQWSRNWGVSKQRRKQRKYRYNAPLHKRQKMVSAGLDKKLREVYHKRSMTVRKGDEVLVMRGEFTGKLGKISKVSLKKLKIYIEGLKVKKVSGQEIDVMFDPSNVKIMKLNIDDKKRMKKLKKV